LRQNDFERLSKMKKVITLVCLIVFTGSIFGQQVVDYILKAKALRETGKADQSVNILNEALTLSKDTRLFIERAESHTVNGSYSEAINDYNEANSISPQSGDFGLSRIYALKGDVATSLYHLELNLKSSFKKSEKEILLDPAFGPVENSPEWRSFWKKDWYNFSEKCISELEYYSSLGKPEDCQAILTELKNGRGNENDVTYGEALVNLSYGKYSDAVRILSGLILFVPENEKYLRILAKAQTNVSNPSGASVTYSKILDMGIADGELLILRADCYRQTGETEKALSDINKYMEYYPESRTAISLAGKVEVLSGDNMKALEYFSKNLKLYPNNPECYVDRANSYFASKSWGLAINDYSMSLDLKPENSDVWLNKGIALLNSGNREDGCHDFRKSLSLGNKHAADWVSRNCIK
jgi:tetratricopeptide (TPR) repeat protein